MGTSRGAGGHSARGATALGSHPFTTTTPRRAVPATEREPVHKFCSAATSRRTATGTNPSSQAGGGGGGAAGATGGAAGGGEGRRSTSR
nr:unnamed protein product [Digitaria exilis]